MTSSLRHHRASPKWPNHDAITNEIRSLFIITDKPIRSSLTSSLTWKGPQGLTTFYRNAIPDMYPIYFDQWGINLHFQRKNPDRTWPYGCPVNVHVKGVVIVNGGIHGIKLLQNGLAMWYRIYGTLRYCYGTQPLASCRNNTFGFRKSWYHMLNHYVT